MGRSAELKKLREVLLHRREAIRRALDGDLSMLRELREQTKGDILDAALDSAQDELSSQLAEVESRELAQIEHALERMINGTYGVCEVTEQPIPLARLQALPYATTCIEAQREMEKHGRTAELQADWGRLTKQGDMDHDPVIGDLELDIR